MRELTLEQIEAQTVLELPDRQLMHGALIYVYAPVTVGNVTLLKNIANNSFNDWDLRVLSGNKVEIDVEDNLSDNDINVFCNQVIAVLAAQCFGHRK